MTNGTTFDQSQNLHCKFIIVISHSPCIVFYCMLCIVNIKNLYDTNAGYMYA